MIPTIQVKNLSRILWSFFIPIMAGLVDLKDQVLRGLEITDQFPLRDGKGSLKEGGIRVPMIVRWDGKIERGSINHSPMITVDFYPTLAELANAKKPADTLLDGLSLVSAFLREKKERTNKPSIGIFLLISMDTLAKMGNWIFGPHGLTIIAKRRL